MLRNKEKEPILYLDLFEKWAKIESSSWDFLFSEISNPKFINQLYPNKYQPNPLSNGLVSGNNRWVSDRFEDIFFKTDDRTIEMGSKYITIGKGI